MAQVKRFKGLNNVSDPLRLGLEWLVRADNVDISDTGRVQRRDGYQLAATGSYSGAYATRDYSRMFVVDAGQLKLINADLSTVVLATGLTNAPMHWAEINREVFYSNGPDKGIIGADNTVRRWAWPVPQSPDLFAGEGTLPTGLYQVACTLLLPDGRETGASDSVAVQLNAPGLLRLENIPLSEGLRTLVYVAPADSEQFQFAFEAYTTAASWMGGPDELGANLTTLQSDPPPAEGVQVAIFAGRMYLMQYIQATDTTVVWFSDPLGFHLFDHEKNFIAVRGQGVLLAANAAGVLIGTTTQIMGFNGEVLSLLAEYGAVPGWSAAIDDNEDGAQPLYFWSRRGLCTAFPFQNLTARQVSVPPGVSAGGAVISTKGARRYVVALQQGGAAFNPRKST